jgi:hypothetical protein
MLPASLVGPITLETLDLQVKDLSDGGSHRLRRLTSLMLAAALAALVWGTSRGFADTGPGGGSTGVNRLPGADAYSPELARKLADAVGRARGELQAAHTPPQFRRTAEVHEPADPRRQPVPPAARAQPGELVSVG